MRKIVLGITLLCFTLLANGQSLYTGFPGKPGFLTGPSDNSLIKSNISTGMSFGSVGGIGFMESFVAPSLSFPINKKFSVTAGVSYSHTRINGLIREDNGNGVKSSAGLNMMTVHATGNYRVNERLTVGGSVYKTINPAFNARLSSEALLYEAQGGSVHIGYQVNDKLHIGAEVRMQQINSNFYNPYDYRFNGLNSPFIY
jgi:long-subunit fatty acid transport protein